jgi:hypothetical protein
MSNTKAPALPISGPFTLFNIVRHLIPLPPDRPKCKFLLNSAEKKREALK